MTTDPSPPSSLPRRLLKGGCCCSFLLFGAVLVAIVLLPSLIGGVLSRGVSESFAEERQGQLEVAALDLSWTKRQRVEGLTLRAPSGERVATASVELPSLLALVRSDGVRKDGGVLDLGAVTVELSADVRIDEEGHSNLEAALAPKVPKGIEGGAEPGSSPPGPRGGEGDPRAVRFALRLTSPELRVTDARLPEGQRQLVVRDAKGSLDLVDGRLSVQLGGACQERGTFELDASLSEFQRIAGEWQPTRWSASVAAADFPAALVDALSGARPRSSVLIGELLSVRGELNGNRADDGVNSSDLSLAVAAGSGLPPTLSLIGRVVLDEELLRPELQASALLSREALEELGRGVLPEGTRIEPTEPQLRLDLRLADAELPRGGPEPGRELEALRLRAQLAAGALDYSDATLAEEGSSLALGASTTSLVLDRGSLGLTFSAPLRGASEGSAALELSTADLSAWSAEGQPSAKAELRGTLRGFSTQLLDLYTEQRGLLVDVLGPSVDVDLVSSELSPRGGPLQLTASSRLGTFSWDGRLDLDEEGALTVSSGESGALNAAVALSPLMGERVVGPLVPLLVDLRKPDASPVRLDVDHLRFPVQSGLRGLNAVVRLDLGQVSCSFLPSVLAQLPGLGERSVQRTNILPLTLQIVDGAVLYERLPLKVDGRPLELSGSYDLVTRALDLSTDVRLSDVGGEVGKLLRDVREVLGDSYTVPLHIGGTPSSPKVGLRSGFLERALQDAGKKKVEDELSRGLKKLFGD